MNAKEYISGLAPEGATLVVVPGTDDKGASNLGRWLDWFFGLFAHIIVIDYPGTVGPLIGGLHADSYDQSRDKAVLATVEAVKALVGKVVILGYSQGAEAAWMAAAQLHRTGVKPDEELELIVWAHPQHPTGLKAGLKRHHVLVSWLFRLLFGVRANGAADEKLLGDIKTTSIAIIGDPVTAFEVWWKNPLGFVLNSLAGFFMIHAGLGPQSAAQLDRLTAWGAWATPGSSTTHVVFDTVHPVEQLLRRCGFNPGLRTRQIIAMVFPLTRPGQRPANVYVVRRNWRATMRMGIAQVTAFPSPSLAQEEARPSVPLAPAS
jgi:pimeloyl-ACP methyl ester carboxylesterase